MKEKDNIYKELLWKTVFEIILGNTEYPHNEQVIADDIVNEIYEHILLRTNIKN